MKTMNVSLTTELRAFAARRVEEGRFKSTSEYVRELIRRDLDRAELRDRLLVGAESEVVAVADDDFFAQLRARVDAVR